MSWKLSLNVVFDFVHEDTNMGLLFYPEKPVNEGKTCFTYVFYKEYITNLWSKNAAFQIGIDENNISDGFWNGSVVATLLLLLLVVVWPSIQPFKFLLIT